MKDLKELNNIYRKLIKENMAENIASGEEALRYINNSSARYRGRVIRTLFMPKLFTEKDVEVFQELVETLYGIFRKVIEEYYKNEGYRRLFGFSKELEELILRRPLYDSLIPMARIDIFYNEEDKSFKFCEFNTDGSSAMNEDRELNIAIQKTKAYQDFAKEYHLDSFELFDSWVEEFIQIYNSYENKVENPHIAIVDFIEKGNPTEFEAFAESFRKKGYTAEICEIRKLKYQDGKLISPTGKRIDAIYRRAVTTDIMANLQYIEPFIQAVKEEEVCLLGEFRTQLVHNKVLFKLLHQDETLRLLTEEERTYVKRHVPYTIDLRKADLKEVLSEKDRWIIKPEDSYGSQGVFAGVSYTPSQWEELVKDHREDSYILQEFHNPYRSLNIDLLNNHEADFEEYSNLTGLYVYNGKLKGVYSRASEGKLISSQHGERTIPTVLVKEKIQ